MPFRKTSVRAFSTKGTPAPSTTSDTAWMIFSGEIHVGKRVVFPFDSVFEVHSHGSGGDHRLRCARHLFGRASKARFHIRCDNL